MNFRFKCALDLYRELGRQDAIAETTEVAVRTFLDGAGEGKFSAYLSSQSKAVGINVDNVDIDSFKLRISMGYLMTVHQSLEIFLINFRTNHIDLYGQDWDVGDLDGDLLTKTLKKIGKLNEVEAAIGHHYLAVLNYYRLIRNNSVHADKKKQKTTSNGKNQLELAFDDLAAHIASIRSEFPNLESPNLPSAIKFDDFLLFTRVLKLMVDRLMDYCKPTEDQLFAYYSKHKLFKKLSAGSNRKRNALLADMNQRFGIERTIGEKLLYSTFASLA